MEYKKPKLLLIALLCIYTTHLCAKIKLPALVAENMVLQRNQPLHIWGWAKAGENVDIEFQEKTYHVSAQADGKWSVLLAESDAGGPYKMEIKGQTDKITLKNILIGDVFLCSGQSNMEQTINQTFYAQEIAATRNVPIRQFKINRNESLDVLEDITDHTGWQSANPQSVKSFTAVGYFFARDLYDKIKVPIGIINSSYGSSLAEAWISKDGLKDFPELKIPTNPKEKITQSTPTVLYNAMLAPILGYPIKGVIWYQGEFNKNRAFQYRSLLPALINNWREKYAREDLPFLIVQLPNYDPILTQPAESAIAELREAQMMALALPYTGIAVSIDINSNTDLHPKEKKPIGERLSLVAQNLIYNRKVVAMGPLFKNYRIKGDKVIISFSNPGDGLIIKGDSLQQFTIAGADRKFKYAKAEIKGKKIIVYNPDIAHPQAVRYAWADNPMGANLYNKAGLPAAPFRTDSWPGITAPKSH